MLAAYRPASEHAIFYHNNALAGMQIHTGRYPHIRMIGVGGQ
jgi:hypothetical protein